MWQFESNTRETLNEMFIFACRECTKRYVHTHRELMNICLRISKLNNNDVVNCVKNFKTFVFTRHNESLCYWNSIFNIKLWIGGDVWASKLTLLTKLNKNRLNVLSSSHFCGDSFWSWCKCMNYLQNIRSHGEMFSVHCSKHLQLLRI